MTDAATTETDVHAPTLATLGRVLGDGAFTTARFRDNLRLYSAVDRLVRFAESELLCYRATHPDELVRLQADAWQPWLDWLRATHGVGLVVSHGLMPMRQPEAAVVALRRLVAGQTAATLTGLGVLVPGLGSLVLGLAVATGRLDAAEAFRLACLDSEFQASHWGRDREAEAQAARLGGEILVAARFMTLANG